VQEGRGDKALLLARSDSSGWLINDRRCLVKQWPVWCRTARSMAEQVEGKSEVGGGFLGDVRSSDKGGRATWGGDDRRLPMSCAVHAVSAATVSRGSTQDRATILGGQTETGR
jgi:hypothetical protein